jgi:hypothetical protein
MMNDVTVRQIAAAKPTVNNGVSLYQIGKKRGRTLGKG